MLEPTKPAVEVIEFVPFESQKRVFTTDKRFIFAMGGNRGGKTTAGCYWSFLGMQVPETNGLIGANTIDQLNQSTLAKFFEIFPQLKRYYVKRDRTIYLPNGSKVFTRSLDMPELLKGLNLHWEWIDEGDGLDLNTWNILRSRVATTGGKILVTSSIYSNSWIFDAVYNKKDPDYEVITWESRENPSFPKEEWDALKRSTDPVTFAREYSSEFVFATGKVYGDILGYGRLDNNQYLDDSKPVKVIFGLDYGVNDPTAITVITLNDDGRWYIVEELYSPKMSIQQINFHLEQLIKRYGRPFLTVQDPAGGVARLSLIPEANAVDAVKDIHKRITLVRDLIYQHKLYYFGRCVNADREFHNYQFNPKRLEEPEDRNNHVMDSMGMAIFHTYDMIHHLGKKEEPEEEMTSFWARKMEQGIYKGKGVLEDWDKLNNWEGEDDFE